jgi:hypothetical protein
MSLLESIKATTEQLEHMKELLQPKALAGDPAVVATQKRLEKLTRDYAERLQVISERVRQQSQRQQSPDHGESP